MPREFISRFSPNRTAPEVLEKITVQRQELLANSIDLLRESVLSENKHHLLFVGPRGSGKTHLLSIIVHRLQQQPELENHLRIAWLNEDETSTSFLDLLIRIYRALSERYPKEFPLEDLNNIFGRSATDAREALSRVLVDRAEKRTLLIMIENLDTLFAQLDEAQQRSWRSFIQNNV